MRTQNYLGNKNNPMLIKVLVYAIHIAGVYHIKKKKKETCLNEAHVILECSFFFKCSSEGQASIVERMRACPKKPFIVWSGNFMGLGVLQRTLTPTHHASMASHVITYPPGDSVCVRRTSGQSGDNRRVRP